VVPGGGVVSGSHDFSLRFWTTQGETLLEMLGHTALVYSVACSSVGTIASASEDRSVRIWSSSSGAPLQTLLHPTCVWSVAFSEGGLPGGPTLLASAAADAVLRLWSQSEDRRAPAEEREKLQQQCLEAAPGGSGGEAAGQSGVEMNDPKVLKSPGSHDGQVKVVREGETGVAYSWNEASNSWDKIGEVVSAPSNVSMGGGGRMHQGVMYDYVFDVELDSGPARKLPFNKDQNPYDVAEHWLENEGLPGDQKEQVVNFLVQNTGVDPFAGAGATNVDPYTGGASYTPQAMRPPSGSFNVDPYTGSGSYVPSGPPRASGGALPLNADPYTGGGAYNPQSGAPASPVPTQGRQKMFVPHSSGMLTFDSAPYDGLMKKLSEIQAERDGAEEAEAVTGALSLLAQLKSGGKLLQDQTNLEFLSTLLKWPAEQIFPVLDLIRLVCTQHPWAVLPLLLPSAPSAPLYAALLNASAPSAPSAASLTALRLLANLANQPTLHQALLTLTPQILDAFADAGKSTNKNVRLAFANLLVNLSVLTSQAKDSAAKIQILSASLEILENAEEDVEVLFRALVATGTTMHNDPEITRFATEMDLIAKIMKLNNSPINKLVECAKDIMSILETS